jgi:Uma2 family endonuclease
MSSATPRAATLDDLYRVEGKAELIEGRIVRLPPVGWKPGRVIGRIVRGLDDFATTTGIGEAFTSTVAYAVPPLTSGRQSFSPDASYFAGPFPADAMRFLDGAPTFAVEVRSETDDDPAAEAARRADYFEAGTSVVWDVDPLGELVRKFVADDQEHPVVFARGHDADAEPAVPGWRLSVDRIFA